MWKTFYVYFPTYLQFFFASFIQNFILCIRLHNEKFEMNMYHSVATCVTNISEKELFWKPTVALQTGHNHTKNKEHFEVIMLKQLAKNNIPYITIGNVGNSALNVLRGSYLLVGYFEDCDALTAFNFSAIEIKTKYLIILDSYTDICKKHFKGVENVIGRYHISVFIKDSADQYDLYTFIPDFDSKTCRDVIKKPTKINSCSNGKIVLHNAFPRKMSTNLKKCPFKVGIGSLYPFAMIENRSSLQTYDRLDMDRVRGMDVEIIKIMNQYFNATLELYYIFKQEENPYVNVEYLPFLLNGSLEACAGGLYRIYGDVVEYSGKYARQMVMWIYTAERSTGTWESMVMNIDGLYLFIVFYLGYSIIWYFICTFDKNAVSLRNTLIYAWGALTGTTSLQDARSLKQKILNIVYLNMCLHLSVYISIQLYSFFTIRDPPEMFKTNEDIMNSGRTAYLKTLTKYFVKDEKYERFANTSVECDGFQDCAEVSLRRKGVTVFISGYFYPVQAATAVNDEARMLKTAESLLTVYYEMIMRKESPLVTKFQRMTVRLFEAGITDKLFKEAVGLTVVGKAHIATQNMVSSSYACQEGCSLSLEQFSGVFYVWGFGCLISCCLFIVEVLLKRILSVADLTVNNIS